MPSLRPQDQSRFECPVGVLGDPCPVLIRVREVLEQADIPNFHLGSVAGKQWGDHPGALVACVEAANQAQLVELGHGLEAHRAVVVVGDGASVRDAVSLMRRGAVDFIESARLEEELVPAVRLAGSKAAIISDWRERARKIAVGVDALSPRQKEVMVALVSGDSVKQAAHRLGTSVKTMQIHRARVLERMGVASIAHLIRLTEGFDLAGCTGSGDPIDFARAWSMCWAWRPRAP